MSKTDLINSMLNKSTPMQEKMRESNKEHFRYASKSSSHESVKSEHVVNDVVKTTKAPLLESFDKNQKNEKFSTSEEKNFNKKTTSVVFSLGDLNEKEREIYQLLLKITDKNTRITYPFSLAQISQAANLDKTSIRNNLYKLQRKNIIEHVQFEKSDNIKGAGNHARTRYYVRELAAQDLFEESNPFL